MMISVTSRPFGVTRAGEAVTCFDMTNRRMTVSILNYGCTIQRVLVPDQIGAVKDVVLGYDDLSGYETGSCYFGALVGRYANRIRGGRFTLDGVDYQLEQNEGAHHLHGVYPHRVFTASVDRDTLILRRRSPAGEEGYPGALTVTVRYRLWSDNALEITYEAETDAPTILNLTNHTYWNLNGTGDILGHLLRLQADMIAESDGEALPTGRLQSVMASPMDFRTLRRVGEGMDLTCPPLAARGGYDHYYFLPDAREPAPFAELIGDQTGIRVTVSTTQPGVQLYSGNFVHQDTAPCGKGGKRYAMFAGLCLETQPPADSPNLPAFPTVTLRPGEQYRQTTVFQFDTCTP